MRAFRSRRARAPATRYLDALERSGEAVLIVDDRNTIDYANGRARAFLGASRSLPSELRAAATDARHTGSEIDIDTEAPGLQATSRPLRVRAVPFADGSVALLIVDLSESRRIDRVRRDFVANVSHELKTPAAAIRALAETASTALASGDLDAARRFVARTEVEAKRLSELVADLLDLSRVEAGEFHKTDVDIDVLLGETVDGIRPVADAKGIKLELDRSRALVHADPAQLGMAVKNLVENAVRYSEDGTVSVRTDVADGTITIVVADEGVGIPPGTIDRIFERFFRVDEGRARTTGGTGLGLAIVRHVAENHGGHVEVSSEIGRGSVFRLVLPAGGTGR